MVEPKSMKCFRKDPAFKARTRIEMNSRLIATVLLLALADAAPPTLETKPSKVCDLNKLNLLGPGAYKSLRQTTRLRYQVHALLRSLALFFVMLRANFH